MALVYADYEALDSLGLNNPDNLKTIMDENLKNLNNNVAAYEKVSKIHKGSGQWVNRPLPYKLFKAFILGSISVKAVLIP